MRAQADEVQTRSLQWVLIRSIAVALAALLIAALAPLSPAKADNHMPWDQQGSAWQGTISTKIHRKYSYPSYYTVFDEEATYSELVPVDGTANGGYAAKVVASGSSRTWHDSCYWTGNAYSSTSSWSSSGTPAEGSESHIRLSLDTSEDGASIFIPALVFVEEIHSNPCTENGTVEQSVANVSVLGYQSGESGWYGTPPPLPDLDPDLYRLVGEKTWTLADPPYELYDATTEYTFTVTYELRLVTNECVNSNMAHDVYRAEPGNEVDQLQFELRTAWCTTETGEIRVVDVSADGLTLLSPMEAVLQEWVRELFTLNNRWAPSRIERVVSGEGATVTATGKWKDCFGIPLVLKTKRLKQLASLFRKIADRAENRLVKVTANKMADLLQKAANKLAAGNRWLAKKALDALAELIDLLPARLSIKVTNALFAIAINYADSDQWAQDYIKDSVNPQDMLIKRLFSDRLICITRWKPRIVHELRRDNTSVSSYVDLEGDSNIWRVRRTGGSF